jgi:alpha-N-acetylglucosamine transferase
MELKNFRYNQNIFFSPFLKRGMENLSIKQLNQKIAYSKEIKDDIWKAINIGMNSNNNYASTYAVEAGHLQRDWRCARPNKTGLGF